MEFPILNLRDHPALIAPAAAWFHQKWDVPQAEYRQSMEDCLRRRAPVPQWYVILDGDHIIAGLGVIENDFHDRRDLAPNLCALYVEPEYRGRGLAGELLSFAARDMAALGTGTLYLITEHDSFYERYGWEYLCTAHPEDGGWPLRLYVLKTPE